MNHEEIRTMVCESIRNHLQEMVESGQRASNGEQKDESLALTIGAGAAGVTLLWAWVRKHLRRENERDLVEAFFQSVDPSDQINREITKVQRRFKLVKSLNDLSVLEEEIAKVESMLTRLQEQAKTFDIEAHVNVERGKNLLLVNPTKERRRLHDIIVKMTNDIMTNFQTTMDQKREELYD